MLIACGQELTLDQIVGVKPADSAKDVEPSAERIYRSTGGADFAVAYPVEPISLLQK